MIRKNTNRHDLHTYPNGLRLITVPMDSTKTVTVLVMVATGSRYETKKISGISHFLEHMMFKGTAKRPGALDIAYELDSIGAEYNAFTGKEYTGYYAKCAADKLDTAIDIISDIFQNSKFDEKEMNIERGPIKEELNRSRDIPEKRITDLYHELAYSDQPLGWDIAGRKEVIDRLARTDIVEYFAGHYFDKNTIVIIAGNIKPEEIITKITAYFSDVRSGTRIEPLAVSREKNGPCLRVEHKKIDQAQIELGFQAYDRFHPKFEAMEVLAAVLGGGMSSRLFTEIRTKRGLAYHVGTGTFVYNDSGDFITGAGLNNERLLEALGVIIIEHKKITLDLVSEKELNRVKDKVRGSFVIGLETSDDMASFYGEQELLEHKIETPDERLSKILAVTAEDVREVARDIFKPEKLSFALIGPFEEDNAEIKKVLESW